MSRYRWDQSYTTEQYARLLRTFSDTLAMEATAREGLIRDLCRLIDARFGGSADPRDNAFSITYHIDASNDQTSWSLLSEQGVATKQGSCASLR